jgi:hypothetical protein
MMNTLSDLTVGHLWLTNDPDRGGHVIPKGTGHGQAGHVLLLDPDAEWPHLLTILVKIRKHSSSIHLDSVSLSLILRFVIKGKRLMLPLLSDPAKEDCSGIP